MKCFARSVAGMLAKIWLYRAGVRPRKIDLPSSAGGTWSITLTPSPAFVLRVDMRSDRADFNPADVFIAIGDDTLMPQGFRVSTDGRALSVTFALPGYWWSACENGSSPPALRINGTSLVLGRDDRDVRWGMACLDAMAILRPRGARSQLLAIEHAGFLAAFGKPGTVAQGWLAQVAATRGLSVRQPDSPPSPRQPEITGNSLQQRITAALRAFNKAIPAHEGREGELLRATVMGLPGTLLRQRFLLGVLPWALRQGLFDVACPLVTRVHLERLVWSRSARSASLALPFLVERRHIGRAARLLRALPAYEGWVVTESVAEASRRVMVLSTPAPAHDLEKFGYALMSLVDAWGADYWGRGEDEYLMDALVVWLHESPRFSEAFRDALTDVALRAYGLSPAFWERVGRLPSGNDDVRARLAAVGERFRRVAGSVRALGPGASFPRLLADDLAFFRQLGCRDADRHLRELVCFQLSSGGGDAAARGIPVDTLRALGKPEGLRLAALPGGNCIPGEQERECIVDLLPGVARSACAHVEEQLLARLETLTPSGMEAFLRDTELPGNDAAGCLSVDILAEAWGRLAQREQQPRLQDALIRQLRRAAGSTVAGGGPPQPLLAALARIARALQVAPAPALESASRDVAAALERRYPGCRQSIPATTIVETASGFNGDVLLVVCSCNRFLDTRVRAIRETWLKTLKARGIPYVILVGDGDDRLDGDVLRLAVSDRYEDLPKKTLAVLKWAVTNTACQYLFKIDDDCFLNVDEWLGKPAFRRFHYHGRILRPGKAGLDRRWHQKKSQGLLARHALDKSPDNTAYADGGTGYCLSRHAMMRIIDVSAGESAKGLQAVSFMEDKLVGDLLAMSGIECRNEGWYVLARRRMGNDAEPVNVSPNTFFPSRHCPVKVAHLDAAEHMAVAERRLRDPEFWPKKLWPSHQAPRLDHPAANQLELLTPIAQAQGVLANDLFVIAVLRNERAILPAFLRHYRSLGVKGFLFVDNLSDDGTRECLLAQTDVVLYSADTEYRHSQFGVAWQQALLAQHCLNKWALVVDADELLLPPGRQLLPDYVRQLDDGGYDAARPLMIDMYPYAGLNDADVAGDDLFAVAPWFDARPVQRWRLGLSHFGNTDVHTSALRHRLTRATAPAAFHVQKFCLIRYAPWMRFSAGLHCAANVRVAPGLVWIAHFKYHAGFGSKVAEEVVRKQHSADAQEYRWYQETLAELADSGIGMPGVSVRYAADEGFSRVEVTD